VIIVIQENRTPDNLFANDPAFAPGAGSGADIVDITQRVPCEIGDRISMIGESLDACFDPNHGHLSGWLGTYHVGLMDGACHNQVTVPTGCSPGTAFPADTYVINTGSPGILQPYFDIAAKYAFANYMFQTNQGPSFEGHQFLFSGTSAPVPYNDPTGLWAWFAGENPTAGQGGGNTPDVGCASPANTAVLDVNPQNGSEAYEYQPPLPMYANPGFPCYTHPTLATLLDNASPNHISWRYYEPPVPMGETPGNTIWTAPNSISAICLPLSGSNCGGTDWTNGDMVSAPRQTGTYYDYAPILTAIANCALQAGVTWVVPDGSWSDHPMTAQGTSNGGPSWVAAIVDAVGNNGGNPGTNPPCSNGAASWANTVILITWDDWGGWYDHVSPSSTGGPGIGYFNGTGSHYVYGFRVPLLVVSAYGKSAGYISGNTKTQGEFAPYIHDFGSILGFTEQVFNLNTGNYAFGIGTQFFPYADYFAPDGHNAGCSQTTCPYPLWDFFNFTNPPSAFVPITSWTYPANCFHTPNTAACFGTNYQPSDPDDDGINQQD